MPRENKVAGMTYCKACDKITPRYKSGRCIMCAKKHAAKRRKMEKDGELSLYRWTKEHQAWVNHRNMKEIK